MRRKWIINQALFLVLLRWKLIEGVETELWVIIARLLTSGWHWCQGLALFFCLYCSAVALIWLLHQHINEPSRVLLRAGRPSLRLCFCVFVSVSVHVSLLCSFCMLQMHMQGVFMHWNGVGDDSFPRLNWARAIGLPAGHPQSRIRLGFILSPGGRTPFQWQQQIEMKQEMIWLSSLLWIRKWKWILPFYALKHPPSIWHHLGNIQVL